MKTEIKKLIDTIEIEKNKMTIIRDNIRTLYNELTDLLESFDMGIENIEYGISELNEGIEYISEHI